MQMPNATQQGIMGLMQKPQGQAPGQQPPMPTPGKASPMAGLGGVDDRVNAYKGNTKPLEQRYAMTQDLLDLLALQKIKSQKEAAARDIQLKMAQQGAEGGQANMTVAQQREQEVNELTKNELAQQVGDTQGQQAKEKQAQMQKLLGSGIAAAPGAASAAQPAAFAAGGIVHFDKGGAVDAARKRAEESMAKLRTYGLRQRQQDPQGYAAAEQESKQAQEAVQAAEKEYATEMSGTGAGRPAFNRNDVGAVKGAMGLGSLPAAQVNPAAPPMQTGNGPTQIPSGAPTAPPPPMPAAPPKPPPMPAAPPGPAAPPPPGPAAPPPPGVVPGATPPPANDFGQKMRDALATNAQIDPMVKTLRDETQRLIDIDPRGRRMAEENRIEAKTALTPEQRGVYQEGISGLQGMYKEQYDPERLQREGLKRALIGAGGRRYGEFAGAATAGMNYDDRMRAAKLKEFGDVQNARTGLVALDRANVKEGIGAGQKVSDKVFDARNKALEAGYHLYNTDVGSRDKALNLSATASENALNRSATASENELNREIDKLKISAQNAATAAAREGLSQDKNRNLYLSQLNRVEQLERNLEKDFAAGPIGMLLMQDPTKLKPEDKNRLDIAKLELEQKKAKIRKDMEPVLADVRRTLGITDSKMSPEDRAVVDKYAKGK